LGRAARRVAPLCALALLVAGSTAFLARRAAERWGVPEQELRPGPTGAHQRWFEEGVLVTLDESLDGLGPEAQSALAAAFGAWQDTGAPLPEVSFTRGRGARPSLTPDGVNSVMVAPIDFEGHETDLAITIGFSHPKTGEITEADIVINSRHVFSVMAERARLAASDASEAAAGEPEPNLRPLSCLGTSDGAACGQTYDLQNVLTHEVGHFWGLPEDFEDRSSTMYSCTSACEVHKRRLTPHDAEALVRLYGASTARGCAGAQFARGANASGQATALAVTLGLGGLWWGKRRRRRTPER
jgi:hypothetical protein